MNPAAVQPLIERFRQSDRLALARLLSWASYAESGQAVREALEAEEERGSAAVVAVTGSGGVGKSTLIGRLIELLRTRDRTVAVLACDPQSPITGGALLGDRIRMSAPPDDPGVFIRSIATPAGRGGVAENLELMIRLLCRFGFDVVILETVGAGQTDTAVRELADVVVVLVQPETGDELQFEKAGILEIADVVAVNKADLPGAMRAESQLREALHLADNAAPHVLRVSGGNAQGIEELWRAVEEVLGQHGHRPGE